MINKIIGVLFIGGAVFLYNLQPAKDADSHNLAAKPSSAVEDVEQQKLLDGADPTEVFDATAAGASR
jgi:hypothetical protein